MKRRIEDASLWSRCDYSYRHLAFIYLAFWALQSLRIDAFFKALQTTQIRMVMVFLAIALGYTASTFFLELIALCRNLFLIGF